MCGVCGCSDHEDKESRLIKVEQDLFAKNNAYAKANREALNNSFSINLVSSPGSGKTTLLVKTLSELKQKIELAVIEGDQQTTRDADRIAAEDVPVLQINTGKSCHLDAHQVGHAIDELKLRERSLLFIENVGNLVCPSLFDLGEDKRVVVLSVTEGDDKPLKYPDMFRGADLMLINKIDLLPYVDFDAQQCISFSKKINPDIEVLQISATHGDAMEKWHDWLLSNCEKKWND